MDLLKVMMPLSAALAIAPAAAGPALAGNSQSEHVRARIIADVQSIRPGSPFQAAVLLEMEEGWHVNWINPGDAGLAPSIAWRLPDGFRVGELSWPYPRRYQIGPLVIYGYDGAVLLMARVTPPGDLETGTTVQLNAAVDWLACAEACVPGGAELSIRLPVRESPPLPAGQWQGVFEKTRLEHAITSAGWSVSAHVEDQDRYVIEVTSSQVDPPVVGACSFFPLSPGVIEHSHSQTFTARDSGFSIVLKRDLMASGIPERLSGVLVAEPGWNPDGDRRAMFVDVPLERSW